MKFRDLPVGATFDFIDDNQPRLNSFYARCVKTSERKYAWDSDVWTPEGMRAGRLWTRVGSINVDVYHVDLLHTS